MRSPKQTAGPQDYQPDFISGRERLFTVREAARRLGLSRSSIWSLIRRKRLGYVLKTGLYRKVYHIPESALRALEHVRQAKDELAEVEKANRRLIEHLALIRDQLGER
ncbi:helix-turn-helix domain-containing protein [Candidatus Sumerlaeota bacterium]